MYPMQVGCQSSGQRLAVIQRKVFALAKQITDATVVLPVLVRFQTGEQMFTVPVVSLSVFEQGVTVQHEDGEMIKSTTFEWSDLKDIVAFRDAENKPVFLNCENEPTVAERFVKEEEAKQEKLVRQIVENQDVYCSLLESISIAVCGNPFGARSWYRTVHNHKVGEHSTNLEFRKAA